MRPTSVACAKALGKVVNPTLGLILCTDKNDAVVRYTLGPDQQQKIFASRYKLHLPTEAELKTELQRELKLIERTAER